MLQHLSSEHRQGLKKLLGATSLLTLATLLGFLLDQQVSLTSQAMIYVLAVVLAAYRLALGASVVFAISAVLALNFFFVPPRWTLAVDNREHLIELSVLLVVALVISRLAGSLRRETDMAHRSAWRAKQLQALATDMTTVQSQAQVFKLGLAALDAAFHGPNQLLLCDNDGQLEADSSLDRHVRDGLTSCLKEDAVLGPGTGRWPGLNAWFLPIKEQGVALGAACVCPARAEDQAGREHAQALTALLAQCLARLKMANAVQEAQIDAQRRQLQSTFLAAISHDFRTPLSAMVAAATSLQTQHDKLGQADQLRLLQTLVSEAAYLDTMTDNTLQLVRLGTSDAAIQRQWESMEEIIGSVLTRIRRSDEPRRVKASVPSGLPLVKADPVLLSQLLNNLLENALKYTEGEVELTARVIGQVLEVAVHDRGAGIPAAQREAMFQPFIRGDHAVRRGTGLGLAVCRAIAQAHDAQLEAHPRPGGGSIFCLTLPIEAQPVADKVGA
jgi:two-component system sensor histidine kinase KdpD